MPLQDLNAVHLQIFKRQFWFLLIKSSHHHTLNGRGHYPGLLSSTQFLYNKPQPPLVQKQTKTQTLNLEAGMF